MTEKIHNTAIALGGNLGPVRENFCYAVSELSYGGLNNIRFSSIMKSKPENCPPNSPDFINAALTGEWQGTAQELLSLCQKIEVEAGRPAKHGFNAPRTLDLDIILFDDKIINSADLQIPHPRAAERIFVLEPLAKIAPDWIFPDSGKKVRELLDILKQS